MPIDEPSEFVSLAFPRDRHVLYLGEMASRLRVSDQHIGDLIEEGEIQALNMSGAGIDWLRVPVSFIRVIAQRTGISEAELGKLLEESRHAAKKSGAHARKCWRIPMEGYTAFLKQRHSHLPVEGILHGKY